MRVFTFLCFIFVITLSTSHDVFAREAKQKFLDIQSIKTEQGLHAWLVEDHSVPIISIKFAFRGTGSKNDPSDQQGLMRLLSNTLDEGAGDLDSQAFQKQLEDHSISLTFGNTRDHFTGQLKTLTKYKDKAFNLMKLALSSPRFDQDAIQRMRDGNKSRIRSSQSNPRWIAARLQNDRIFEGHPYSLNSGGTLSSLDAITADDLRRAHQTLSRDDLIIAVTGDINAEALSAVLDDLFASLPKKERADIKESPLQNAGKTYLYEKDIPQTVILISQPGVKREDPDYYAAQVMNFILGESGFGSRLMEEAREKRGLTYGIYSYFRDYAETDVMHVSTSTRNESAAEMLSLIHDEWSKIRDKTVSDKELKDAQAYLVGSLPLSLTSTDSIANILLSLQLDHLPIDYLDTRSEKINAVTQDDIQNVAKRLLNPDAFTTILVGKPDNIKDTISLTTLPNVE